jgi:hypothetical protein
VVHQLGNAPLNRPQGCLDGCKEGIKSRSLPN